MKIKLDPKKQHTKDQLTELFINYGEFSVDKGEFFIPYTGLNRIFRESQVLSATDLNKFSVIVKQEVNNKQGIKQITKQQYLNIILRLARFKHKKLFATDAKKALDTLIEGYLLPLLKKLEKRGPTNSGFLRKIK